MKIRKFKKRIYRNRKFPRKVFCMKYIEVGSSLYPMNDRMRYRKEIAPSGEHNIMLSYTDGNGVEVNIGDSQNFKNLPFESQIEKILIGRVKEINYR